MTAKAFGFIFARGGSKGLPGKNLRELGGIPLIGHAIRSAQACSGLERVIVSTDDETIAAVAREYGAETPFMRPAELASDDAPEWMAWRHAIKHLAKQAEPFDIFVSIPAVAPLRAPEDIAACLDKYAKGNHDIVLTVTPAASNPYFSMVVSDESDNWSLAAKPEGRVFRRQDAPQVYDIVPVAYVTSPEFVLENDSIWAGRVGVVVVPRERAVDIDLPLDFEFAQFLHERNNG